MSEATIEYKNSPNESTAYAVSEGQKTKVQLVATPAGDLELADNPNVDTGYIVINGEKHKCALVAEVAGELKLPTSATDDSGYVTTQDGRQHKVKLVANITGGGGTQINNQDINVTQNGIYQAEEGYTGLGTVNVNVASGSPTKFGATIDTFIGTVDANGNYIEPSELVEVDLVGVKSVPAFDFYYKFSQKTPISKFVANDIISLSGYGSFYSCFLGNLLIEEAHFDGIEQIAGQITTDSFAFAFNGCSKLRKITFNRLKLVNSTNAFKNIFADINNKILNIAEVFPALEEIKGNSPFYTFIQGYNYGQANMPIEFPSLKIIEGASAAYSSTFGTAAYNGVAYNLPSVTQITGYVWNSSATFEIHFAAANRAAVEACEGYDYKWGATNATIYFDL